MWTDPVPCRTLGEYVRELIARLGDGDPAAVRRIIERVGRRRARISVDEEVIEIRIGPEGLIVDEGRSDSPVDGEGATDRATVLNLLDGYVEVDEAITSGALRVRGEVGAVTRMFDAIEILLDGSTRIPALQGLGRDYRRDPCLEPIDSLFPAARLRPTTESVAGRDRSLLKRLDLLP